MTTVTDIVNRALQAIGTRSDVTDAELIANSTNEAIQANLALLNIRDDLLRMAPWNFATKTANLTYITSAPGTPENSSIGTNLWVPGTPAPPWAYEYQYPADCLRALYLIPSAQAGYVGQVPITPVTTYAPEYYSGPPIKFKVANDQFYPVATATVNTGGTGYSVGEVITLAGTLSGTSPIGAPAQLLVTGETGGVIDTVDVVGVLGSLGGSYFAQQSNPVAQGSSTGSGVGATFDLTYGPRSSQRVILTNQASAILTYIEQVTDPNLMDTLFQSCWTQVLAATINQALSGDKRLSNALIQYANQTIEKARVPDGNEGLTINDVTPDWIATRGWGSGNTFCSPYSIDWGPLWPSF